jgi:hypothetical protein
MTSIIKVDNLQNQCGANIISESANVITIGASGDTVTLAAGASQSGFGRSGSVNWDTTPKTTTPITSVSGNGYFINTTSIAITVNLPSTPTAGDIVAIADYANTSATNNITVGRNGSLIDGSAIDGKISTNGQVYTLVYVDATEGWKTVGQTFNQITTAEFIAATGGTVTCCGDFKIHTFTGPGTFTVSAVGNPLGSTTVDYLVIAGGGGGGGNHGAGGGAGGFRQSFPNPATAGFPVSVTAYPITVGGGGSTTGSPYPSTANSGNPSIFSTITSSGGGGGAAVQSVTPGRAGGNGGSGGGGSNQGGGGSGNTPPTSPSQGNNGGAGAGIYGTSNVYGGGGGGASAVGVAATPGAGSAGGNGTTTSISGSPTTYGGGGGGSGSTGSPPGTTPAPGGTGGGGAGAQIITGCGVNSGTAGTVNTGGGGGGANGSGSPTGEGGTGGSGIVIIRYKFQ